MVWWTVLPASVGDWACSCVRPAPPAKGSGSFQGSAQGLALQGAVCVPVSATPASSSPHRDTAGPATAGGNSEDKFHPPADVEVTGSASGISRRPQDLAHTRDWPGEEDREAAVGRSRLLLNSRKATGGRKPGVLHGHEHGRPCWDVNSFTKTSGEEGLQRPLLAIIVVIRDGSIGLATLCDRLFPRDPRGPAHTPPGNRPTECRLAGAADSRQRLQMAGASIASGAEYFNNLPTVS